MSIADDYRAAVNALPPELREVFILSRAENLAYSAIAARLALTVAQVQAHLCDALGIIMDSLGDAALPASCRRGARRHVRDNPDLFHHPDDYDRALSVALYGNARCFFASLGEGPMPTLAGINDAAYAVEFALKSYLLHVGFADDWNRINIGHDLERALAYANDAGLGHAPPELQRLIAPLGRYHAGGRRLALAQQVETAMSQREMGDTVRRLLDHVGEATGYAGLPVGEGA